jgi:hypothetical protein
LQTALAAEAYPAGGKYLLEGQTLNKAESLVYRAGTRRQTINHSNNNNNNNNNVLLLLLFDSVI